MLIFADKNGKELGFVKYENNLDLDIGDTNDFEYIVSIEQYDPVRNGYGSMIYIKDTEFGGIVGCLSPSAKSKEIVVSGRTFRGMLDDKIIEPPDGEDHKIVTGELNKIIREVIGDRFDNLFLVPEEDTGINITYQFDRYCSVLNGLEKMLTSCGYRLSIKMIADEAGFPGYVELKAIPIMDYSEKKEYSEDGHVYIRCKDFRMGVNHLICLGNGKLEERLVLHLYVQEDGSIGKTQYYKGLKERTAKYENTGEDNIEELNKLGTERLRELMNYKQADIDIEEVNLEIGDIVGSREYITDIEVKKPIIGKILKIRDGKETVEYKLKGDD